MIELIATAESVSQGKALIETSGIDTIYIGAEQFSIQMPQTFTEIEMMDLTASAQDFGKKVCVAVNGLLDDNQLAHVVPYLEFLEQIGVDSITVSDPRFITIITQNNIQLPYIFDGETVLTTAEQINIWAHRGASSSILARDLSSLELRKLAAQINTPAVVQVYGPKRVVDLKQASMNNNLTRDADMKEKKRHFYIMNQQNKVSSDTVFATNDINLMSELNHLSNLGIMQWKLDSNFNNGEDFLAIAELFSIAKEAIELGQCDNALLEQLHTSLKRFQLEERRAAAGLMKSLSE